ncbi:Protein kinase superfamily protein [Euphorbia peplus]|nr:Protein kinase superfamily protein [Euphorbia peplus]
MNCFPCFQSQKSKKGSFKREHGAPTSPTQNSETKKQKPEAGQAAETIDIKQFRFHEIATATRNFKQECLLGEGGSGKVFKGTLASNGQVVAIKQLDRSGMQENKDFLVEVKTLSLLKHQNLTNLIGYCADGDQRFLVYEYITGGSLQSRLFDLTAEHKPLDWFSRMKIGFGCAQGLEYLHNQANPSVVFGELKPTNVLLDEDSNPRLSDFGLVKLGSGDKNHFSSRIMGTYGYSAPEYARGGELTLKSDVYSFGVIFLELITGRRAMDTTKPNDEQNLVAWAQPIFRNPKRFPDMADPLLGKSFPEKDLNQAVAITAMCLQEEPDTRPLIGDVVTALTFLSTTPTDDMILPPPTPPLEEVTTNLTKQNSSASSSSSSSSSSSGSESGDSGYESGGEQSVSRRCSKRMQNHEASDSSNDSNRGGESFEHHNSSLSQKNIKESSNCYSARVMDD